MEFHFFWRFMSKSLFDATLYCFCSTKFRDKFIGPWKLLWYVRNRSKMYKFFLNMNRLQHFDMKIGVALVLQEIPKFQKLFYIIFIRKTCSTEMIEIKNYFAIIETIFQLTKLDNLSTIPTTKSSHLLVPSGKYLSLVHNH